MLCIPAGRRSADTLILVSRAVGSFIKLYLLLLFVRVLLSWFPKFEWDTQPWLALRQVCALPAVYFAPDLHGLSLVAKCLQ